MHLYPGEHISEWIVRDFEPGVRRVIGETLRPGMTFVDAGANLGLYTAIAAKLVGPSGKVYAFEPSAREYERAKRTVEANKFENVELYRVALGEKDGTASLNVCEEAYGAYNSVGKVSHFIAQGHVSHVEEVSCRSLDSFAAEKGLRTVGMVKIDVEGAEAQVLRGGRKLFSAEDGPLVVCELSDWTASGVGSSAAEAWELLAGFGYTPYAVEVRGKSYRLSPLERQERTDYLDAVALKPWQAKQLGARIAGAARMAGSFQCCRQ